MRHPRILFERVIGRVPHPSRLFVKGAGVGFIDDRGFLYTSLAFLISARGE